MGDKSIYKVIFQSQGNVCEIYARSVSQAALFGFVEVQELLFGERSSVVVDPSEDKLKIEFKGVRKTFIPMHAVLRIDEVERPGPSRVTSTSSEDSTLTRFPSPFLPGPGTDQEKDR